MRGVLAMRKKTGLFILTVVAVLSVAGAAAAIGGYGRPWSFVYQGYGSDTLAKVCDAGRAIYMYDAGRGASIQIVENAKECQYGR